MKKYICTVLILLLLIAIYAFAQPGAGGFKYKTIGTTMKLWVTTMPYAWDIAEGNISGHTGLNKFGFNADVDSTEEVIWEYSAPTYEYLDDDDFEQFYLSSDNGADTGIEYTVEGIDCEYNAFSKTVDTDGVNFVAIDTACDGTVYGAGAGDDGFAWRVFRVYCTEAKSNPTDACAAGTVYISKDNTDVGGDGIPDTVADIQATVTTGKKQTNMAMWTVPIGKTLYIVSYYAANGLASKPSQVDMYIRPFGEVFRSTKPIAIDTGYVLIPYDVPLQVSARSDIVIRATTAANGGSISAGFSGWYE